MTAVFFPRYRILTPPSTPTTPTLVMSDDRNPAAPLDLVRPDWSDNSAWLVATVLLFLGPLVFGELSTARTIILVALITITGPAIVTVVYFTQLRQNMAVEQHHQRLLIEVTARAAEERTEAVQQRNRTRAQHRMDHMIARQNHSFRMDQLRRQHPIPQ